MLIVGAGVAGLALARALQRRGVTAEVVERMTQWQPSGAGLYLPGNAVRALHDLGIAPAAAGADPIRRQRLLDHRGRLLADIDLDRLRHGRLHGHSPGRAAQSSAQGDPGVNAEQLAEFCVVAVVEAGDA